MQVQLDTATDQALKCRAMELLAYGVLPFEQWAHVFANTELNNWPGLQAKAFSVWFPTMVEFLQGDVEASALQKELGRRNVDTGPLFDLISSLAKCYEKVLAMYSIEDQIFIRDRRLQNVHGRLQLNTFEVHNILVFDPTAGSPKRIDVPAQDYRGLMTKYYSTMAETSNELLRRLLQSSAFSELTGLYLNRLKVADHFGPLIEFLGISAIAGDGNAV